MAVCPIAVILGMSFGPWARFPGSVEIGCGVTLLGGGDDERGPVLRDAGWLLTHKAISWSGRVLCIAVTEGTRVVAYFTDQHVADS
jgi:hypothetical protein